MCYNCRHMRYARYKKPLVIALFLIFTVSMALVGKSVYAEETVEPTEVKCSRGNKSGDKDKGYQCSYEEHSPTSGVGGTRSTSAEITCPTGSHEVKVGTYAKKCVKGAASSTPSAPAISTVEPTEKKCSGASAISGDKDQGYWCPSQSRMGKTKEAILTCPAGSSVGNGEKTTYKLAANVYKKRCVTSSSSSAPPTPTPAQQQKVEDTANTTAGNEMFAAAPELKNITSDPKIVGKCARNSKQMTTPEQRRTLFVNCLASATGKPGDAIKQALGEVDPGNAAEKGEKAREDEQQKQEQIAQEQAAAANGEGKPKEECGGHVEGIGYFLCPILERLVDFADGTWGLFEFLLQTNPLPNDSSESLPSAWSGLRDVANAILAIVFLAIIISQVSNIGISNYGIKKMLPRLIIAAVAINISYFLMQIITDIANILGSTLYDFISDLAPKVQYRDVGWATIITDIATTGIAVAAIGAGATAAGHAMSDMDPKVGLLLLFVFIVPAILGLIAGLMALVFRAGIIPVLAISAPIAFAAWVLPNTQKLFEKWKSTFLGMLFLYPLASLYCGGLKFVALSLMSQNTEPQQVLFRMMGVTMLLLGSGFVAVLAIKSNSIMGSMIGGIKNIGNKLTAPAVNSLSSYAGALKGAKRAEFLAKDHSKAAEAAERNKYHRLDPRRLGARVKHATGRRMQAHDERMAQAKMQAKVYESAVEQEEKRKYEAKVAENPALLGRVAETVGGKSFIKEAAYKSAGMELQSKYNGNAVRALNESDNEYVKALAAKEIAERGSAGEIDQVREYLQKGGSINNTDMAEALMKMKGRDAGVAAAGKAALDKLEESGGAPVYTGVSEMHRLTQEGFDKLGDKAAVEQNAAAIQAGGMEWEQAARVLGDRHIMREAPQENIEAIKASIQANITQQIKSGSMDAQQATKVLDNKQAMQNISDQTKRELENIVTSSSSTHSNP